MSKRINKKTAFDKLDMDRIIKSQQKAISQRRNQSDPKPSIYRLSINQSSKHNIKNKIRLKTQNEELNNSFKINLGMFNNPYMQPVGFKKKYNFKQYRRTIQQYKDELLKKNQHPTREIDLMAKSHRHKGRKAFYFGDNYLNDTKKESIDRYQLPKTGKNYVAHKEIEQFNCGNIERLDLALVKKKEDQIKKKSERTVEKQRKIPGLKFVDQEEQFSNLHSRTKSQLYERKIARYKTLPDEKSDLVFEKKMPNLKNKNPFELSRQQLQTFGNRFPNSFDKIKLLGRGGFALVWLGEHIKTKKQYAIKQIKTENNHQTHIKQIWFGTYFYQMGGIPKKQFIKHIGIQNLVKLYSYDINRKDTWIFYEKCGQSLGSALYELRGDNLNNQRVYRAVYKPFYYHLRTHQNQLRKILVGVSKALILLSQNKIVHSDLKTENILIRVDEQLSTVKEVKLIDYGSSFRFGNLKHFSMATPEYMAPEILNYILHENQMDYAPKLLQFLNNYDCTWAIDMWSLGCVLLEVVSGIPLWMSLMTLVKNSDNAECIKYGAFAVKGRLFDQIIKKQIDVVNNIDNFLTQQNYSGIILEADLKKILKRMLSIDPVSRISPQELVNQLS